MIPLSPHVADVDHESSNFFGSRCRTSGVNDKEAANVDGVRTHQDASRSTGEEVATAYRRRSSLKTTSSANPPPRRSTLLDLSYRSPPSSAQSEDCPPVSTSSRGLNHNIDSVPYREHLTMTVPHLWSSTGVPQLAMPQFCSLMILSCVETSPR
ncbi:hypothetical protein NL676_038704 [Syzygium grande]|nr:hypothetical protein NL676_038704 [Syzygium grande]